MFGQIGFRESGRSDGNGDGSERGHQPLAGRRPRLIARTSVPGRASNDQSWRLHESSECAHRRRSSML
jgi:hypothetical protein